MQDTERVERVLIDYLRKAEASPTEDGDLEAKAASMAARMAGLLTLRVVRARVVVLDEMVHIRVQMRSAACRRTVTAGVSAFAQLAHEALNEIPWPMVSGATKALRAALPAEADALEKAVMGAAEKITSNQEEVQRWKDSLAATKEAKVRKDREDLVSRMSSLLASGWTRDMLLDSVNQATCSSIMHG
jgi:hypothetical protein